MQIFCVFAQNRLMKKTMKIKQMLLVFLSLCFCVLLVGCGDAPELEVAHISDITGALSTDYAIKVVLDDDDRVSEKYVGLQIKANKDETVLQFGEELGDDYTLCLPQKDYWYNLTYLISKTNGVGKEAGYLPYEEYGSRVFRFSAKEEVELTFRMVAGKPKENPENGEQILVLSEPISKEVKMKLKKAEE